MPKDTNITAIELRRLLRSKFELAEFSVYPEDNDGGALLHLFKDRNVTIKEVKSVVSRNVPGYTKLMAFSLGSSGKYVTIIFLEN